MNYHVTEFLAREHLADLYREAQAGRLAAAGANHPRRTRTRWAAVAGRLLAMARGLASASRRRLTARSTP
jgi:hypothetical protein